MRSTEIGQRTNLSQMLGERKDDRAGHTQAHHAQRCDLVEDLQDLT
jgi:hypothetical protein